MIKSAENLVQATERDVQLEQKLGDIFNNYSIVNMTRYEAEPNKTFSATVNMFFTFVLLTLCFCFYFVMRPVSLRQNILFLRLLLVYIQRQYISVSCKFS